jgi:hypothetical protein
VLHGVLASRVQEESLPNLAGLGKKPGKRGFALGESWVTNEKRPSDTYCPWMGDRVCLMKINDRFDEERGEVVELIPGGGCLPDGLTQGFQVRVVGRIGGDRRLVEREGREWVVAVDQIRFRRRAAAAGSGVQQAACETWNLPLRGVRPMTPQTRGIAAINPGFRRAGH